MARTTLDLSTLDPKHAAKLLKNRVWLAANREKVAAQNRAYVKANREKVAAKKRAWRAANPEKVAADTRAWRAANPEKEAAYSRAWRAANPEKVAAGDAKLIQTLPDSYLRRQFVRNLPIAPEAVPQEAIEIYRLTRLIGRAIKEQTA